MKRTVETLLANVDGDPMTGSRDSVDQVSTETVAKRPEVSALTIAISCSKTLPKRRCVM